MKRDGLEFGWRLGAELLAQLFEEFVGVAAFVLHKADGVEVGVGGSGVGGDGVAVAHLRQAFGYFLLSFEVKVLIASEDALLASLGGFGTVVIAPISYRLVVNV